MNEQKAKNLIKFLEPTDRVSGNPCEVTNEQINGDRAVATVKSDRYPNGIEVAFVKENGDWKMTSRSPAVDSVKLAAPGNISAPPNSEPPVTLEQQPHVNIQALNLSKGPRRVRQLTIDTEGRGGPACIATTPKNKIVYCSKNGETGDLWIMDSDGRNQRQLTFDDPLETSAAVSPDGRQVAFGVAGQGIWKVDMDGGNRRQLTQYGMFPFYSKDGKWIYYTVQRERWSMWKVSSDGGEPIRVTDYPGVQPAVSPNGKLIAYMSGKSIAELKLYVAPVEGGAPLKIFDAPPLRLFDIGWSPDGKSIAYNVFDNGVFEIVGQPLDGGAPQVLISTNSASESFRSFAFSRDGKQLFYSTGPVN
jgi:TolB protein